MYYFSETNIRGNHAGTKARNDVETILKRYGAKPINSKQLVLKSDENENIYSNIRNRFDFLSYFLEAMKFKNKIVILQYPMLSFDKAKEYVKLLSKRNRVVFLVHDIHSLRRGDYKQVQEEIQFLNLADSVILHNRFMEEKLNKLGLKVKNIYKLNIFDYLHNENCDDNKKEADIVFAGNLGKSEFLNEFIKKNNDLTMNFYGIGFKDEWKENRNVNYVGNFNPDILPKKLNGKFGLIWDGNEINTCTGNLGEYTRINNPHKLSLYVSSGIPVIAWKESAIAEYIIKNNLGIIVDSLTNLKCLIESVPKANYIKMCENVQKIKEKIIDGNSLNAIIKKIENK